jgi:glucosylceramidase
LEKHGLTDIQIYLWDHNKERVWEWMRDIIDDTTDPMVTGAAFHWYSGDHFEALDLCRQRFPDKKLILSESCIEFSKFDADDSFGAASLFAHEMLGDLNHGICFFGDWNLILDEEGGPNYVGNYCLAPFLFDTKKKQLQPQLLQQYMEHFSRTLTPGSVRIGMSRYAEGVEVTAWKRPDGSLALVLLNKGEKEAPVVVRLNDQEAALVLMPRSISSAVID